MLTQFEFEMIMDMLKRLKSKKTFAFPAPGDELKLNVESITTNDKFIIDINRKGQIKLKRCTYQTRYQKSIVLLRIDLDGPPHTNPDLEKIDCPHIHIYKEGYETRWAYPLKDVIIADPKDLVEVLIKFLEYNKINNIPKIEEQMFLF